MNSSDEEPSYDEDFPPASDSKASRGFVLVIVAGVLQLVPALLISGFASDLASREPMAALFLPVAIVFIACTTFIPAFLMRSGRRSGNQQRGNVGFVWLIISSLLVLAPGLFVPFPINVLVMIPGGLILGGASLMKQ
jgi:hypothetical protein